MHDFVRQVGEQRLIVEYLRRELASASTPVERETIERRLTIEATRLQGMTIGARRQLTRVALPGGGSVELLSPEAIPVRTSALHREFTAVVGALRTVAQLHASKKGSKASRDRLRLQYDMLLGRKKLLEQRLFLLSQGRDLERPRRLDPSRVPVQRVPLVLPAVYTVPSASEVQHLIWSVAQGLRRLKGEPDRAFRMRLRAYVERAVVRYIAKKAEGIQSATAAADHAVSETLQVDAPAIEAESREGGVVADPVTESVGPAVDMVSTELDRVMEELHPAVLVEAEVSVPAPTQAPVEFVPSIYSQAPAPVVEDKEQEKGWFTPKNMIIGGVVVIGGIAYFLGTRRRTT